MSKTRASLLTLLAAAPLLGGLAVTQLGAQSEDDPAALPAAALPAAERAAFEAVIRDYLLDNPEVLIESLERFRDRETLAQAQQAEDAARRHLAELASGEVGFAIGASEAEAEVIVVEFFDYHCGYCRRAADFAVGLAEEDGVRVVFQDLPILREESRLAALAGLAAAESGDYVDLHLELMRTSGTLNRKALDKAGRRAGAPEAVNALDDEARLARLEEKLGRSVEIARDMAVDGTPAFIVASADGAFVRVIPGFGPEQVTEAVDTARRAG